MFCGVAIYPRAIISPGIYGDYAAFTSPRCCVISAEFAVKSEVTSHLSILQLYVAVPQGVANIIDAALQAGAAVALLGATCSVPEEEAMSAAAFALGARRCTPVASYVPSSA